MKKFLIDLMCFATLSISLSANDLQGSYIGVFGGIDFQFKNKDSDKFLDNKLGCSGGLFCGYKFCNSIRVEGELSYRNDRLKSLKHEDVLSGKEQSRMHIVSLMANALYDFDLHP